MNGNDLTDNRELIETETTSEILPPEDWDDDEGIWIENDALLTVDTENSRLVVVFDQNRNAIMEFNNETEMLVCQQVLSDPNFWAQFLGSFSAALKEQAIGG